MGRWHAQHECNGNRRRATTWLTGYIPDLPTPFDPGGKVDLNAFRGLCERQIQAGVPALVVCETAGEASTLSPTEQERLIRTAVDVARGRADHRGRRFEFDEAIELTRRAEAAGADAILSVVPYYNKPMQTGITAHFRAIADSTRLPIILHDIPARTVRELANDTLARLAESGQFIGLRDGSGDVRVHSVCSVAAVSLSTADRRRRDRSPLCGGDCPRVEISEPDPSAFPSREGRCTLASQAAVDVR